MEDLNDLFFFSVVVQHNGFSAAARAIGVEKTRLSRRVAALEKRMGVRLLRRSTRSMTLTEAGERFYERCQTVVEGAQAAYESISELKNEPSGNVKLSCPVVLAQSYLAPILAEYMTTHPKVSLVIEATDRQVNLVDDRFDLALRVRPSIEDSAGLVARDLGRARRILIASPAYLDRNGRPDTPKDLNRLDIISRISDLHDGQARWTLSQAEVKTETVQVRPRLVSDDLRVQLEAAINGIGIALLPEPMVASALVSHPLEVVLPEWVGPELIIHLVYPRPRGMLPSVRSLIDYLLKHIPATVQR